MEKGIRMGPGKRLRGKQPEQRQGGGNSEWVRLRASALSCHLLPICSLPRTFYGLPGWGSLVISNKRVGGFADN